MRLEKPDEVRLLFRDHVTELFTLPTTFPSAQNMCCRCSSIGLRVLR